jgi:hypothetical protein
VAAKAVFPQSINHYEYEVMNKAWLPKIDNHRDWRNFVVMLRKGNSQALPDTIPVSEDTTSHTNLP